MNKTKLTFERFEFLVKKIEEKIYEAMKLGDNKMFEKFNYMYLDIYNDYPEYMK